MNIITKLKYQIYIGKYNIIFKIIYGVTLWVIFSGIDIVHCEEITKTGINYLTRAEYQDFFLDLTLEEKKKLVKYAKKMVQEAYINGVGNLESMQYTLEFLDKAFISDAAIKEYCMDKNKSLIKLLNILYNIANDIKQLRPDLPVKEIPIVEKEHPIDVFIAEFKDLSLPGKMFLIIIVLPVGIYLGYKLSHHLVLHFYKDTE